MKWIIYLLLLANIAVFFWHYRPADRPQPAGDGHDAALSLVLLDEAQNRPETSAPVGHCYSLGPFETTRQAGLAAAALKAGGIRAERRVSKDARRKAYWVLLPPAESRAEARKSLKRLKELKVHDYFLVPTGEKANAISLGVFSKFESAHRRIKQMQKLGFKPTFEKVELPRREYWLDWPVDAGKPNPGVLEEIHRVRAGARLTTRACGDQT